MDWRSLAARSTRMSSGKFALSAMSQTYSRGLVALLFVFGLTQRDAKAHAMLADA
jgi:hypothetical protein